MEKERRPAAEVVLTVLHAGGKFGDGRRLQGLRRPPRRRRVGGQRAVRVAPPHGLARRPRAHAVLRARHARRRADQGAPRPTGAARASRFLPDLEIFETIEYDRTVLEQRFREMAFLTKGLKIDFRDERGERFETSFQYDGGIVDFVNYLHSQGTREPLHQKVVYIEDSSEDRRGRGRPAVERLLPGGAALVRQQHQHARGRHAPVGLPLGAHPHDQRATRARRASSRRRTPTSRARTCARASPRSSP